MSPAEIEELTRHIQSLGIKSAAPLLFASAGLDLETMTLDEGKRAVDKMRNTED